MLALAWPAAQVFSRYILVHSFLIVCNNWLVINLGYNDSQLKLQST